MTLPLRTQRPLPLRARGWRLLIIVVLTSLHVALANVAGAQATLSHTDDAIPIPGGWVRLSVLNVWERYDSRFGESATVGLGDPLSTDSLGPRQLPRLSPAPVTVPRSTLIAAVQSQRRRIRSVRVTRWPARPGAS